MQFTITGGKAHETTCSDGTSEMQAFKKSNVTVYILCIMAQRSGITAKKYMWQPSEKKSA